MTRNTQRRTVGHGPRMNRFAFPIYVEPRSRQRKKRSMKAAKTHLKKQEIGSITNHEISLTPCNTYQSPAKYQNRFRPTETLLPKRSLESERIPAVTTQAKAKV